MAVVNSGSLCQMVDKRRLVTRPNPCKLWGADKMEMEQ